MLKKITNFVLNKLQMTNHPLNRTSEGGKPVRFKRIRKFKTKGKKLAIAAQLLAIWYLLIITGSYLTSDTGAYFNDVKVIENYFHAKWDEPEYSEDDGNWGKSSLKEVSIKGSCENGILARFTNTGESVNHELTKYEIYWIEKGNPKFGEIITTGNFPIPNKGEFFDIFFKPLKNGIYKVKAYHETRHGNGNGDEKGPWSDDIQIKDCTGPIPKAGNNSESKSNVSEELIQIGEETETNNQNDQ